jgi:hypothetical protein
MAMAMAMEGRWQDIDRLLLRDGNLAGPGFEPGPEVREKPWCFSPFSFSGFSRSRRLLFLFCVSLSRSRGVVFLF